MSTFTKVVLGLNVFNILYCIFFLGMISAGAHLPFWPFFIVMILSSVSTVQTYLQK